MAAILDTATLGKVILYSLLAGVGIAVVFGLGVSSVAGLLEARRERRTVAGAAWGLAAAVCLLVAAGAAVLGVVVLSAKS